MTENLQNFFLIVPPGFEQMAAKELRYWFPEVEISEQSRGGIGFKATLEKGCGLNQVLKVPARILVRLADFGCSDFPKLFKKTKSFNWAEWLPKNSKVQVEASTHQSRLKIKKRIETTVLDALRKSGFKSSADDESTTDAITVYVRIVEDVCYLSLDTSGVILHKRGYREYTPDAPLRENLAAAILMTAKEAFENVYGEKSQPLIIDPMAGSGTFLIEALNLFRKNNRDYSFERFVNYSKVENEVEDQPWVSGVFGIESDTKAIVAARKAFTNFGDKHSKFAIEHADVFQVPPTSLKAKLTEVKDAKNKILVCNPPYGKRLKIEEPFAIYYPKLLNRFEELFAPQIASIILPQKVNLERLKLPPAWEMLKTDSFSNGGFSVVLATFNRSTEKTTS